MTKAEVNRGGLGGVRPGREARTWSGTQGERERHGRADHPGDSYYGMSVINPPVWEERDIAGYLFLGGLAGSSSIIAAGADLSGRSLLARRAKLTATGAIGLSLVALVHDLGRPERFLNMLRVLKPTSPMSVGSWLLFAYGPLNGAAAASDLLGVARPAGRAASAGAAALGAVVATYTAALIADTAVPAWHGGHRELPFVFAGSASAAGAGAALVAAPLSESAPARRLGVAGAVVELVAEGLMERRLGMVAEALHTGTAGRRLRAAKALTAAGALAGVTVARRSRIGAVAAGACLLAGSALTRFGIFAAGMESSRDPRYTVEPQRERIRSRADAGAPRP